MSAKHCTTHHHACDCREAKFKALREAAQAVVDEVMMPVEGDYHYREEESAAMDKLKAALK